MHWQLQIGFHFSHVSHIFWGFKGKSNSPTFFRQFLAVFRLIRSDLISTINQNYTHKHADFDRFAKIFTTFFSLSAHVCHTRAAARIGRYYLCKIFASLTFLFYFCFPPKWLRTVWPFRLGYLFSLSLLTFWLFWRSTEKPFAGLFFVDFFVWPVWSALFLACVA